MPFSLFIAAVIGAASVTASAIIAGTALTAAALLTGAALSVGLSLVGQLLSPRQSLPDIGTVDGSITQTTRAPLLRPRYIVGRARVGGYMVYYREQPNPSDSKTPRSVVYALVLCGGPIEGIDRIWINGEEIPWNITSGGGGASYTPSEEFKHESIPVPIRHGDIVQSTKYPNNQMSLVFHLDGSGSTSGVDSAAPLNLRDDSNGEWTTNHRLKGLAYVYVKLFQPDYGNNLEDRVWSSLPQIEFLVKGLKFSWPGQLQPIWTDNAAAIRYWWERNVRGLPVSAFDHSSVISAVAACEQMVALKLPADYADYAASAPKYTVNGVINLDDDSERARQELDFAWQGEVVESGGVLFFRPGIDRPTVGKIDAGNIMEAISFQPQRGIQDRTNALSMQIAQSNAHAWSRLDLPEFEDAAAQTRDGGKLPASIGTRAYVSDPVTAGRIMATQLRRERASGLYSYRVAPGAFFEALLWLPTDRLLLNDPEYGFVNVRVMIDKIKRNDDWSLNVTMHEAPDGIYNDDIVLPPLLPRRLNIPLGDQRGAPGQPGEDGEAYEYVFARTATASLPANQRPSNDWLYASSGTVGGLQWVGNNLGPTNVLPFEWQSRRSVPGAPEVGDDVSGIKGDWSAPVIVLRFPVPGQPGLDGIIGADGADGVGLEFIFAATAGASIPVNARPSNGWGYDAPATVNGVAWKDAAPNLSASKPYLWRAQRAIIGAPNVGDLVAASWRTLALVGRYGVDGSRGLNGIIGANGEDGDPGARGAAGAAGIGLEYIFARSRTQSAPASPSNSWGYDNPTGSTWTDAAPSLSASVPYLWRAQRRVPAGTLSNGPVSNRWTAPRIVGHFGADGSAGVAGPPGPRIWQRLATGLTGATHSQNVTRSWVGGSTYLSYDGFAIETRYSGTVGSTFNIRRMDFIYTDGGRNWYGVSVPFVSGTVTVVIEISRAGTRSASVRWQAGLAAGSTISIGDLWGIKNV